MLSLHEQQQGAEAACCTATVPSEDSRLGLDSSPAGRLPFPFTRLSLKAPSMDV